MNHPWSDSLSEATRYEIAQHGRNRIALALVVGFIPIWLTIVHVIISSRPIGYHDHVDGRTITVDGNHLAMISGAMNATTLIIGFLMFSAVRRATDFDRRLVLAGYSRSALLLAKLLALLLATATVALYATIVLSLFWAPHDIAGFFFAIMLSGLTYGGLGIVLGLAFRSELAGMFLIIMISLVDVMVQNPIISPSAQSAQLGLLPTFGAMQNAVGAAFTGSQSAGYYLLGLLWLTGAAVVGLVAFQHRTRDHIQREDGETPRLTHEPAVTVVLATAEDGTLVVRSSTGPVVLCTCADGHPTTTVATPRPTTARTTTRTTARTAPRAKPAPKPSREKCLAGNETG